MKLTRWSETRFDERTGVVPIASSEVGIVFRCAHTVKAAGLLEQSSASGAVLQTAPTLTVRPHRNDGSQEDAKQEQPADGGLLSYAKKLCLFFKKHPPGELHNQKML